MLSKKEKTLCGISVKQYQKEVLDELLNILNNKSLLDDSQITLLDDALIQRKSATHTNPKVDKTFTLKELDEAGVFDDNGNIKKLPEHIKVDEGRTREDSLTAYNFSDYELCTRDRIILDAAIVAACAKVQVKYIHQIMDYTYATDDEDEQGARIQEGKILTTTSPHLVTQVLSDVLSTKNSTYTVMSGPDSYDLSDQFKAGLERVSELKKELCGISVQQYQKEFLDELQRILKDPNLIDKAVETREFARDKQRTEWYSLTDLDNMGVFDEKGGEVTSKTTNMCFDRDRVGVTEFKDFELSLRERIILDAAFLQAGAKVKLKYQAQVMEYVMANSNAEMPNLDAPFNSVVKDLSDVFKKNDASSNNDKCTVMSGPSSKELSAKFEASLDKLYELSKKIEKAKPVVPARNESAQELPADTMTVKSPEHPRSTSSNSTVHESRLDHYKHSFFPKLSFESPYKRSQKTPSFAKVRSVQEEIFSRIDKELAKEIARKDPDFLKDNPREELPGEWKHVKIKNGEKKCGYISPAEKEILDTIHHAKWVTKISGNPKEWDKAWAKIEAIQAKENVITEQSAPQFK